MSRGPIQDGAAHRWYARPVLFVTDLSRALEFYVDRLGFTKAWHEDQGKGTVCQVNRSDCEIILSEDPNRRDRGRLVELTAEGIAGLREEIRAKSITTSDTWWGYDVIQVDDPDGNELLFPYD